MRSPRLAVILLLVASAASAVTIPPIDYKRRVLENGLEVYTIQDRSTPTVAIQVWYRVGSKHDPAGRSGFAHLFEHMMFKSTKNMKSEMFDRFTEDVGGFNNATTLDDATAYYEVVPSNYLETLIWAEAERMGSLTVDATNFASERDVVKEEFRYRVLAPSYGLLFYAIDRDSFTVHPYRRPGIGSIEDLDAATIDDVRAFHQAFYRPDNAVLIVAGDFDREALDGWIDRYFGAVTKPSATIPGITSVEPKRVEERRRIEVAPNVPLPAVAMTWLIPAASDADAAPLVVASTILGQGEASRLQEKLVRTDVAQEIFLDADLREDLGRFTAVAFMASGHAPIEAEKLIRAEIASMAEKGVSAAELEKAKNLILTSALRERETANGRAFTLGEAIVLHRDPNAVNRGLAKIQAVTAADVRRVMKKYVVDEKAVVIDYLDETPPPDGGPQATGGAR